MKVWIRGRSAVLDRVPGGVDVGLVGAREAADHRALDAAGDRLDRLEVAGRGDREAGLDHVDAEPRQLLGDLDLLLGVERDPRRLLAVAQRGVEDVDPSSAMAAFSFYVNRMTLYLAAIAPPSAIPPEGGGEGEARGCGAGESSGARRVAQAGTRGIPSRRSSGLRAHPSPGPCSRSSRSCSSRSASPLLLEHVVVEVRTTIRWLFAGDLPRPRAEPARRPGRAGPDPRPHAAALARDPRRLRPLLRRASSSSSCT